MNIVFFSRLFRFKYNNVALQRLEKLGGKYESEYLLYIADERWVVCGDGLDEALHQSIIATTVAIHITVLGSLELGGSGDILEHHRGCIPSFVGC